MTRHIRLMITALTAAAALAALVGTASAQVFVLSNNNFRAVWSSLELTNTVNSSTVRCPVTLEGTFHSRTIVKIANSLIGYVTRAAVNNAACTGGNATILNESLPWHITYQGFEGRLPAIESIRINLIRASFQIAIPGFTCLASTTTAAPASGIIGIGAGGVVTGITADPLRNIPLRGGFCFFGNGRFSGTASVTLLGTTTRITVTLI